MSYMSAASLNLSDSFPKPLELGELKISAELSTIPELNREQQKIGFGGFKYEDLNKSPLFGRGKIKVGFYRDWILEFSYTPSLEIKGAKPKNLYGLAMSKQIIKLGGRPNLDNEDNKILIKELSKQLEQLKSQISELKKKTN